MRKCASRFQLLAVVFPVYLLVIWVLPVPISIRGGLIASPGSDMHLVMELILLGPWWMMLLTVLFSLLQIINRANWAVRIRHNLETRAERVASKKQAMGAAVGQARSGPRVEPPPVKSQHWDESGDIPLSDNED